MLCQQVLLGLQAGRAGASIERGKNTICQKLELFAKPSFDGKNYAKITDGEYIFAGEQII